MRQSNIQTDGWTDGRTGRQAGQTRTDTDRHGQTDQTDRQDRQTDGRTDRTGQDSTGQTVTKDKNKYGHMCTHAHEHLRTHCTVEGINNHLNFGASENT